MIDASSPIGLFDSGFGGLTVMKEVIRLLPFENLIYLGDTAHLPYGDKSPETVLHFARENASFLLEKGIKLLIIPCHTACSHALAALQKELPIPVLGVIEPGIAKLALLKNVLGIAVLGTTSTIESGVYQRLIQKEKPETPVYAKACPLFVPLIEEGFHHHPSALLIAKSYLEPLQRKIDVALLACTHYPLIHSTLQQVLGPKVRLIEPAEACAQQAKRSLEKMGLLNPQRTQPFYEFFVTDNPQKFCRLGKNFLQAEIERVEKKGEPMQPSLDISK